jgi:GNAT superfamily N-acetyltransferase
VKPSPLARKSIETIDAYWASSFGCPVEALRPQRALVVPHPAHVGFNGIYAMTFGREPIIALPAARIPALQPVLGRWTSETIGDATRAHSSLGDAASETLGPAWLGYADAGSFRAQPPDGSARMLVGSDSAAVEQLRAACTPLEWEHGGSAVGHDPIAGTFVDGTLAALAGYETWGGKIAHIAIVSHPAYRGRGLARAAVVTVARHALANGLILQYRTLESNTPSRRIGDSLGFVPFARSLAIRLSV